MFYPLGARDERVTAGWLAAKATPFAGAVFLALGVITAGCAGAGESGSATPHGTIGFPSAEGRKTVYVLISPETGVVKRLHVRHASRDRVFLFWYDGARIWTLDAAGVSLLSHRGTVRLRVPVRASTPRRVIGGLSWSPDGDRFVYTDESGLFVDAIRGGKPKQLVAGADLYESDWSPHGDQIAFVARNASDARRGSIQAVNVNGRGVHAIVDGIQPDISPDGKRLAYATPAGVWVIPLSGGAEKLLVPGGGHPEWSPDGRYLAYTHDVTCREFGCSGRVFVIPSSGGQPLALGPQQFDIGPLFWSP